MNERAAYAARVREFLTGRPMEWIPSRVLRSIGGADAWRTRVSEVRRELEDAGIGTITNKLERTRDDSGNVTATLSYYRFEPARGARCDEVGPSAPERFIPPADMPVFRSVATPRRKAESAQGSLF